MLADGRFEVIQTCIKASPLKQYTVMFYTGRSAGGKCARVIIMKRFRIVITWSIAEGNAVCSL